MKRNSILLCLLLSCMAEGRNYYWSMDSIRQQEPNYLLDKYHDLLRFLDPVMYLSCPCVQSVTGRTVPLQEGKEKNGYFPEGNIAYRLVIEQGKLYFAPWIQRMRSTFDAGITIRMTNVKFNNP